MSSQSLRVLDVACGTGRTLKMMQTALPKVSLFGVDLSSAYLRKANQFLSQQTEKLPQLLQANAEDLPYRNDYFQGVTSVFLFHELPPSVRQKVINQCFRVLQPGGVFVICDSIQEADSAQLKPMLDNFSVMFHEPYYKDYIRDNIEERLKNAGFENIQIANHFVSKYWIAYKTIND